MNLKKYFVIVSIFLALIGSIYIYIQYNLARHSVYYASQMPRKEGTRPELVMAVENKNLIDKPNDDYVYFDEEVDHTIYIDDNAYFTSDFEGYYLRIGKQRRLYFYHTDSTGKFMTYYSPDDNWKEQPMDKEILQEIEEVISPVTEDIIKVQKTPSINLQKLFNQKYESIFN
ncbi:MULTISPECIES: hypothetical protein [unclassified Streptococcus]|uniref:hypothetical protein n=1 Tax=unclassified Streptococcus TaxID=2608887 RepID=UPI001072D974|nr:MULTISPECIES: hypothetical protein [unclassified Streptococcus]MBF0806245.1 hypothetical protein [Streptococcus sp. 19428wA2_WM07]TFU28155.1 hypothetical protein E4T71_05480 [Streptococcus sp. WM07]